MKHDKVIFSDHKVIFQHEIDACKVNVYAARMALRMPNTTAREKQSTGTLFPNHGAIGICL
jgi:hypothetical protein